MKRSLYALLAAVSILFTSCGPSSNTSTPQRPSVSQPQPQPQLEVIQKVVIGHLVLNGWEFENLFPTVEWKYLTHINANFTRIRADGTLNINPVRKKTESVRKMAHRHNVKILISLAKNSSGEFTTAINDSKARKELVQQIIAFTREYRLDDFDIDYEEYDNWDKNFLSLLVFARGLYLAEERNMPMTCAVNSHWPNYGTEWEQYFDYIDLMSYDQGTFTDKPIQHASYGDLVGDPKCWNEQCQVSKSKIVGGLPFYGHLWEESLQGTVDDVRGVHYSGILKYLGSEAADKGNIGKAYYNGRPTIANKCRFIRENNYAGMMIWQLFQNTHNGNYDLKLMDVVDREMTE